MECDVIIKIFDLEYKANKYMLIKNSLFFENYFEEFGVDTYEVGDDFIYVDENGGKAILDFINDVSISFTDSLKKYGICVGVDSEEINDILLTSLIYFDFFQFDRGIESVKKIFSERKINIGLLDKYICNENIKSVMINYVKSNTIEEEEIDELFRYKEITDFSIDFIFIKTNTKEKEYIEKIRDILQIQIIYYDDYIDTIEFYKFIKSLKGIISNYDELNNKINLKMIEYMQDISKFKEYYKIIGDEYFLYKDVIYFKKIDEENMEDNYPIMVFKKDSLKSANKATNVLCWKIISDDAYCNIVNIDNLKLKVEVLEINNNSVSIWNFKNNYLPDLHTLRFTNCSSIDINVENNHMPKLKNIVLINSTIEEEIIKKLGVKTYVFHDSLCLLKKRKI